MGMAVRRCSSSVLERQQSLWFVGEFSCLFIPWLYTCLYEELYRLSSNDPSPLIKTYLIETSAWSWVFVQGRDRVCVFTCEGSFMCNQVLSSVMVRIWFTISGQGPLYFTSWVYCKWVSLQVKYCSQYTRQNIFPVHYL